MQSLATWFMQGFTHTDTVDSLFTKPSGPFVDMKILYLYRETEIVMDTFDHLSKSCYLMPRSYMMIHRQTKISAAL